MKEKYRRFVAKFKETILDDAKRRIFLHKWSYTILFIVSAFMTIVNIITNEADLSIVTCIFSFALAFNILLVLVGGKCVDVSSILFEIEFFCLFIYFIISGSPQGFSALWSLMLPTCGLLLFGTKQGTILSVVMLISICFLFYTPTGQALLKYEYNSVFMLRFPMLYLSFLIVSVFFEVILHLTQEGYQYMYRHDSLTDAFNRKGFEEFVKDNYSSLNIDRAGFIIIDIDLFKRINDKYGHSVGDEVLIFAVNVLKSVCEYPVCRWGGEEFVVFVPDYAKTEDLVKVICDAFRKVSFNNGNNTINLTVSAGAVVDDYNADTILDDICKEADQCLYEAKANGRNQYIYRIY